MATSQVVSRQIAHMISEYLGPAVARGGALGATLNALRVRLDTGEVTDEPRTTLSWQVREAIRTEFFKIKFPAPPAPSLLRLVSSTEALLTGHASSPRPYYFPAGRVTVPVDTGNKRRTGTTLQLRFKPGPAPTDPNVAEALVHLDGEEGGAFRWVQVAALSPLAMERSVPGVGPPATAAGQLQPPGAGMTMLAPRPGHENSGVALTASNAVLLQQQQQQQQQQNTSPAQAQHQQQIVLQQQQLYTQHQLLIQQQQQRQQQEQQKLLAKRQAQYQKQLQQARLVTQAKALARARKEEALRLTRLPQPMFVRDALPPAFVPDALRSASPPPRKRLRQGISAPVCLSSGSVHGAANALRPAGDAAAEASAAVPLTGGAASASRLAGGPAPSPSLSPSPSSSEAAEAFPLPLPSPPSLLPPAPPSVTIAPGAGAYRVVFARPPPGPPTPPTPPTPPAPRTMAAITAKVLVIERLVARRENASAAGVVEYFVKWRDVGWDACSWESRGALLLDVPGLVMEFDVRHPAEPSVVRGVPREAALGEREAQERCIAEMKAREVAAAAEVEERRRKEAAPILIPAWFETPLVELAFAGMVAHVRRDETALFSDAAAAGRDLKRRRARFKQDYPEAARRLFVPTKAEAATKERSDARASIEAVLRTRKLLGSRPVQFPRALGSALPTSVPVPPRAADIAAAPPSWEWYLQSLGLECADWSRNDAPYMPTAGAVAGRAARHARAAADAADREAARERAGRLARDGGGVGDEGEGRALRRAALAQPAGAARTVMDGLYEEDADAGGGDGGAVVALGQAAARKLDAVVSAVVGGSVTVSEVVAGKTASAAPLGPSGSEEAGGRKGGKPLLRVRNAAFGKALAAASAGGRGGGARVYDAIWSCWRDA
jgi:hypothetical protein